MILFAQTPYIHIFSGKLDDQFIDLTESWVHRSSHTRSIFQGIWKDVWYHDILLHFIISRVNANVAPSFINGQWFLCSSLAPTYLYTRLCTHIYYRSILLLEPAPSRPSSKLKSKRFPIQTTIIIWYIFWSRRVFDVEFNFKFIGINFSRGSWHY